MKNRILLFLFVTVALVVAFIWLLSQTRSKEQSHLPQSEEVVKPAVTNSTSYEMSTPTDAVGQKQDTSVATNLSPAESRSLQIKQAIEGMNVPISFYGRVIDQESNGLPGVVIAFRVMQPRAGIDFALAKNMPKFERTTDASGNFSVEGITGSDLDIESVSKDGYRLSSKTQMGYRYGPSPVPFNPDPQNPVIIRMWKELATKEPLITGSHVFGIDSGKIYTLDLIQGKKFEGQVDGDLQVSITRPSEVNSRERYPWSFSIEALRGGIIQTDDEFMYLAPETGYETGFSRQFDPADSDWNLEVNKQFFIRTRDGRVYGRVQVTVYSVYNIHSAIEVNYAINPNGSRNLQP